MLAKAQVTNIIRIKLSTKPPIAWAARLSAEKLKPLPAPRCKNLSKKDLNQVSNPAPGGPMFRV